MQPMIPKSIKREVFIAIHSQSRKFRIVKWIFIILIAGWIFVWKGMAALAFFIGIGFVLGFFVHFYFRHKTNGWRKQWGKFKPIKTPYD